MPATCIICYSTWEEEVNEAETTSKFQKELQVNQNKFLVHSFCSHFKISHLLPTIQWDFQKETLPFCSSCVEAVKNLIDLKQQLLTAEETAERVDKDIKGQIQETLQSDKNDGTTDSRVKIIRDLIVGPKLCISRVSPPPKRINPVLPKRRGRPPKRYYPAEYQQPVIPRNTRPKVKSVDIPFERIERRGRPRKRYYPAEYQQPVIPRNTRPEVKSIDIPFERTDWRGRPSTLYRPEYGNLYPQPNHRYRENNILKPRLSIDPVLISSGDVEVVINDVDEDHILRAAKLETDVEENSDEEERKIVKKKTRRRKQILAPTIQSFVNDDDDEPFLPTTPSFNHYDDSLPSSPQSTAISSSLHDDDIDETLLQPEIKIECTDEQLDDTEDLDYVASDDDEFMYNTVKVTRQKRKRRENSSSSVEPEITVKNKKVSQQQQVKSDSKKRKRRKKHDDDKVEEECVNKQVENIKKEDIVDKEKEDTQVEKDKVESTTEGNQIQQQQQDGPPKKKRIRKKPDPNVPRIPRKKVETLPGEVSKFGYCGFEFNSTDMGEYQCGLCPDKVYKKKYDVVLHIRWSHMKEKKSFLCDECGKDFHKSSELRRHVKSHGPGEQLACHICGGTYKDEYLLSRHMTAMHERGNTALCHFCSALFFSQHKLLLHIKQFHSAEAAQELAIHRCKYCVCTFVLLGSLTRHMRRYHRDVVDGDNSGFIPNCNGIFPTGENPLPV